jgi:regulation of enolase protein 1 (concanavalin A-like superfamily)
MYVPGLPFPLTPSGDATWTVADGAVRVTAAARTDLFVDPGRTGAPVLNAPTLVGTPPAGDFRFSARVTVGFAATYDAGVLLAWIGDERWGKLCFEYSPDRAPMIVSVVTRGVSDDANSVTVDGDSVWLRVTRIGAAIAYHASTDATVWRLVRHFTLDDGPGDALGPFVIGFEVQSPTGDGCTVVFDDIAFATGGLGDLRDGS